MSSTRTEPAQGVDDRGSADRIARRLLDGPIAAGVGLACAAQVGLWAPSYLTWPYWADHDVFATAARSWDAGIRPYRDLFGNNFPGTTYIFWALGKLFGWTSTPAFYAFDAALVAALGLLLGFWSRRNFGSRLPGWIGYATFLGYYLDLDYSQAAQRDWQGPFFAASAILILQSSRGKGSIVAAGLALAVAASIRPQVAFFLPGVVSAIVGRSRDDLGRVEPGPLASRLAGFGVVVAGGLALAALPLIWNGIFDDFLRQLRLVVPGGRYNIFSRKQFQEEILYQVAPLRVLIVPLAIVFLGRFGGSDRRRDAAPAWLWTFAAVLLYRPLSPQIHAYLMHPITLTWSILVAVLAGRIWSAVAVEPVSKLLALMLLLGLGSALKPRFSNPNGSKDALAVLRRGIEPNVAPPGYAHHPKVPSSEAYKWRDYRDLLRYIRSLPPEIRVANALKHVPAVNGPTGRLPVFPAESIAWLVMIRKEDEPEFAEALRESTDSVVVWAPSERHTPGLIRLETLTTAIEELYEFDRRFGAIEAWRRKPPKD